MNPYDTLLIELLNRLDKKADRLISLLEVSQHRKERLVYEFCELAREIREKAGDGRGVCKGRNVRDRPR